MSDIRDSVTGSDHENDVWRPAATIVVQNGAYTVVSQAVVQRLGAFKSRQSQGLYRKQSAVYGYRNAGESLPQEAHQLGQSAAQRITVHAIDGQGVFGRRYSCRRGRAAMNLGFAFRPEPMNEVLAAGDHGQWGPETLGQGTDQDNAWVLGVLQAQRTAAATAIRVDRVRTIAPNAQGLGIVYHQAATI